MPPSKRAEREGVDLGAIDVDAGDAGGELVVAHRPHRAAEPRVGQTPDEIADERQHRDAEGEIALATAEQRGPRDVADAVGPVRHGIQLTMTSVTICWKLIVTIAR